MCRYCKKLKELKDLDRIEYERIIKGWQRRDSVARQLVIKLFSALVFDGSSLLFIKDEVDDFLKTTCVGK